MTRIVDELEPITHETRAFRDSFNTLQLSTATANGSPITSYAPFVQLRENEFGIYLSELTSHTHKLINNPKVAVLFAKPENAIEQPFARQCLTYVCNAVLQHRDTDAFNLIVTLMEQRFKGMPKRLAGKQGFHLFVLTASHATYQKCYTQTYEFKHADLNRIHLGGLKHFNNKKHSYEAVMTFA